MRLIPWCETHECLRVSLSLFSTTGASVSSTRWRLPPSSSSISSTSARFSSWTGWGPLLAPTWAGTNKWARVVIDWPLEPSGPHGSPLFSSFCTFKHHFCHILSGIWTVPYAYTVTRSHIRSPSYLISAHHMQELDCRTSCRHPGVCFFISSVHLNFTSWFAEFGCLIDLLIILATCEHSNPVPLSLSRTFTMVTALRKPSTATPVFCTSLSIDMMMATSSLAVATPAR